MFICEKIKENVTSIMDPGNVRAFLIEGTGKAVLIDTCCGLGNLKELAGELTKLPLEVICTHGHVDHAGGSYGFDTVYLSPADWELVKQHTTISRRYAFVNGDAFPPKYTADQFVPQREGNYSPLTDGQIFDLGGITLECIAFPGHTRGMTCVLIREYKTLILGDACNPFTFLFLEEATDIRTYMQSLRHLLERTEEFDTVWLSHGEVICPKSVMETVLETCETILERKDDAVPYHFMGDTGYIAVAMDSEGNRRDGKTGNVVYHPDKL